MKNKIGDGSERFVEIPDSAKKDYERGVELIRRAAEKDPNYKQISRMYQKKENHAKDFRLAKGISVGALAASLLFGGISAYDAYRAETQLSDPKVVQEMSVKEVQQLKGRYDLDKALAAQAALGALMSAGGYAGFKKWESEVKKQDEEEEKGLVGKTVLGIISILGVVVGLNFLSKEITGNVIANLNQSTSSIIGVVFLFIVLLFGFFWFRNKK